VKENGEATGEGKKGMKGRTPEEVDNFDGDEKVENAIVAVEK
jgi:hypothetical protein